MSRFLNKIIDFLLKRTEHLNAKIETANADDPMQKKIQELLEKKELMKSALKQNTPEKKN